MGFFSFGQTRIRFDELYFNVYLQMAEAFPITPKVAAISEITAAITDTDAVPADVFLTNVLAKISKPPTTGKEAIHLFKYLMVSEIEPIIEKLTNSLVANLPDVEKKLVLAALKATETIINGCGCWGK